MTVEAAARVSLHLLRHADAGDPEAWPADDDLRPLSGKGVGQAERLGRHLDAIGFEPDVIVSSPKLRALQTAEIVARVLRREVRQDARLGGWVQLGTLDALLEELGRPRAPLLVGHDPDLSDLVSTLTGASGIPLKKGALARIDLVGGIEPARGVLRWLLPPDLLPREP